MTCQIPESIISKIMLYNSHPTADIIKTHYKKMKMIEDDRRLEAKIYLEGYEMELRLRSRRIENRGCQGCGNNLDEPYMITYCSRCC